MHQYKHIVAKVTRYYSCSLSSVCNTY